MHELKETDREAVLLRYFENRQFAEVGAKLGLNENAARMRVERALEKLRAIFAKRGITTATTFASVISTNAIQTAPANLAATLATTSIATTGTGTFTLLKIMTATKLKLAFSALAIAGATTALVIQHQGQAKLRVANERLTEQLAQLESANVSNQLARAGDSKSISDEQFRELLRLRGEVGVLRQKTNELGKLREENQRLQAIQTDANRQEQTMADAKQREREMSLRKMGNAKQGMIAFIMFADDNQKRFPTNFAQAALYLKNDSMDQIESNFDIVYQGSRENLSNSSATIVLKEKQAWQTLSGKWFKTYGFADGHSEIHSEPDGNFDAFEKDHTILLQDNQ
jgi:hypothetical protein